MRPRYFRDVVREALWMALISLQVVMPIVYLLIGHSDWSIAFMLGSVSVGLAWWLS